MAIKNILKTITAAMLTIAIAISMTGCNEEDKIVLDTGDELIEQAIRNSDNAGAVIDEPDEETVKDETKAEDTDDISDGNVLDDGADEEQDEKPTDDTTQTTKPPTATTAETKPSAPADTAENGKPVVTTVVTAATTTSKPAVTTTPAPVVTTTPAPVVTTQPAPSHTHSYSSKITKEPTCTATGIRTYTCSCGNSYTETISAKGHDWKSETIHHDAVTEEGAVTEEWTHVIGYIYFPVTELGIAAGVGTNGRITVKVLEYYVKRHDEANIEWVYRYDPSARDGGADKAINDVLMQYGSTPEYLGPYETYSDVTTEMRSSGTETVIIKDAYDEIVYTCSVCGVSK